MKKYALIPVLLLLLTAQSCKQDSAPSAEMSGDIAYYDIAPASGTYDKPADVSGFFEAEESSSAKLGFAANGATAAIPLKLIKEGELGFETADYKACRKMMTELAGKYKGYISKENEVSNNYRISNELIIRVPSENVDALMNEIASGAKLVDYKRMNLTDVTEEFVDLETRLKTKKEVEQRYIDILKKAQTIKDILEVEDQLRVIREEIEASQGRLKYLSNRVDLSSLTVAVHQELDYKYIPEHEAGFFERALKSLDNGWRGLQEGLLGLINLWPFIIVLGIITLLFNRWRKRRKAQK